VEARNLLLSRQKIKWQIPIEMVGVDENGIFVMHEANRGHNALCARCGETYNRQQGHICRDKR